MVVVVLNGDDLPKKQELVKQLASRELNMDSDRKAIKITSVHLNVNKKNTNVIFGDRNIKIYGSDTIADYIGKYKFNISPHSFFQLQPWDTGQGFESFAEITEYLEKPLNSHDQIYPRSKCRRVELTG